jgi:small subunit ribosomal protein S4e
MPVNHLSRLNAPKSWPIRRKGIKFIKRPNAGAHTLRTSITLSLVLTSVLKYVRIGKEVRKVLHEGNVLVNGKIRRDPAYPVGIMDVVSLPKLKESYRVLYTDKGKFTVVSLVEKEQKVRAVKIKNKSLIKSGKVQLNFTDGTNTLVQKDVYKTEDTLLLSLEKNIVEQHIPFKEGAKVYLTGGNSVGKIAILSKVNGELVTLKIDGKDVDTARKYVFIVEGLELGDKQ